MDTLPSETATATEALPPSFIGIIESLPVPTCAISPAGRILGHNHAFLGHLLGPDIYGQTGLTPDQFQTIVGDMTPNKCLANINISPPSLDPPSHFRYSLRGVFNDAGRLQYLVTVLTDITREVTAAQEAQQIGFHDPLTGLYNRAYLNEEIDRINTHIRHGRLTGPITVFMLDIDGLKRINDTYGHQAGDAAIKIAAEILRDTCRETDFVARRSGDEFIIIIHGLDDPPSIQIVIDRIKANCDIVAQNPNIPSNKFKVTFSIGAATFDPHTSTTDLSDTCHQADMSMYQDKKSKKSVSVPPSRPRYPTRIHHPRKASRP